MQCFSKITLLAVLAFSQMGLGSSRRCFEFLGRGAAGQGERLIVIGNTSLDGIPAFTQLKVFSQTVDGFLSRHSGGPEKGNASRDLILAGRGKNGIHVADNPPHKRARTMSREWKRSALR